MPNLKAVVREHVGIDGKSNIKIRISHNKKTRYIRTSWYIEPKYMGRSGQILSTYPGHSSLNRFISGKIMEYNGIIERMGDAVEGMDINTIVARLRGGEKNGADFIQYAEKRIKELKKEGRFSYANSYEVTLIHIKNYSGETLLFRTITYEWLSNFEVFLRENKKINTARIYLNNIRAIINHAADRDVTDINPFRKFKVKQEQSQKRSLDIEDICKLKENLFFPAQQRSVDLFMLSFYLIGMNLKDLLYLKPEDVYKGRILYKRFKTGTNYSVKIFPEAAALIEKYKGEKHLLKFLDPGDCYEDYKNFLRQTNYKLREAGKKAGLGYISTYSARHSWATIAAKLDVSIEVISHALGHSIGSKMTNIYVNFDMSKVDEANEKVIDFLCSVH